MKVADRDYNDNLLKSGKIDFLIWSNMSSKCSLKFYLYCGSLHYLLLPVKKFNIVKIETMSARRHCNSIQTNLYKDTYSYF